MNDNKFSLSEDNPTAEPGLAVAAEAGDHGQPTDQDTTNNATHSEEGPSLESAPVEESGSPVDAAPAPEYSFRVT